MSFRPGIPDHIKKAILSGNRELLSRAGRKGARVQREKITKKVQENRPDGKSLGAGERND